MNKKILRNKLLLRGVDEKVVDFYLVPKNRVFRWAYEKRLTKLAIKKFGNDVEVSFQEKGAIILMSPKSVAFVMENDYICEILFKGI